MTRIERFEGCILGGAIGDAYGSGYENVVDSVPLSISAASRVQELGLEKMFSQLIKIGGDTDTNCSIAGQIAGTLIGKQNIPTKFLSKLAQLPEYEQIEKALKSLKKQKKRR